jgi:hypothetical protein
MSLPDGAQLATFTPRPSPAPGSLLLSYQKNSSSPPGKKFLGTLCHPACGVVHCTTLWSATWLTCEKTSRNQKSCTVQRYGLQPRMSVFL